MPALLERARRAWRRLGGRRAHAAVVSLLRGAPLPPRADASLLERQYGLWLERERIDRRRRRALEHALRGLQRRPLISVLMPVYDVGEAWLREAIGSVRSQIYPHWELCVVDDASPAPHVRPLLQQEARRDPRVHLRLLERNEGIGGALNHALRLATGEFVSLVDHDDVLRPEALLEVALRLDEDPALDVLYSDHDLRSPEGRRESPFFKPDWSPDLLLSMNYVTHFVAMRRELVQRVGGYRSGVDGAEDHDLLLRVSEQTTRIAHIPRPLYSWGRAPASVAATPGIKPYAQEAGRRAIQDALQRRGIDGEVLDGIGGLYRYRVRRRIRSRPLVSILVAANGEAGSLRRCLCALRAATDYSPIEVVVAGPGEAAVEAAEHEARFVPVSGATRAACLDAAARVATGEHIVLFGVRCEPREPSWLEAMLEHSQRADVGAVGAKLVSEAGRIRHAGLVIGLQGVAGPVFAGFPEDHPTYWGLGQVVRDVSAVSGSCLMSRRQLLIGVGGLDGELGCHEDVDFCLRVRERGARVIYTPHAVLRERAGPPLGDESAAVRRLRDRWGNAMDTDPFYSPQLTLDRFDCSLRIRRDVIVDGLKPSRRVFRERLRGRGIEIGALHDPMPLTSAAQVRYVDRLTLAEQVEHYPELAEFTLVPPDLIAAADRLDTIGAGSLDFVIANGLLPQIEDPIAAFVEWHRVLASGGLLFLAIPDHGRTPDRTRPATTIAHLIADHGDGGAASRLGHYEDYSRAARGTAGDHTRRDALELMARGYAAAFHAFSPDRLRELLRHLRDALGKGWDVAAWDEPAEDDEFLVLLKKADE